MMQRLQSLLLKCPFSYMGILYRIISDKHSSQVLDVACGRGGPIKILKEKVKCFMVGIDIFLPRLKDAKQTYDECILCDAHYLPFKERSFDIVLCLALIEYLEKEAVYTLIERLEKITRRWIVLYTPTGFPTQSLPADGNIWQQYTKSGWIPKDFKKMGYKVRGSGGLPFLRKFRYFAQPFVFFIPEIASHMICAKYVRKGD